MKTKELIRLLNEEDPTGEEEVCVGNTDIHFVECLGAYYDGPSQVLERDESKSPYYNIVGAKYKSQGKKIQIHTLSIKDAISNHHNKMKPDEMFPVDYSELSDYNRERTIKHHLEYKEWHKQLDYKMEFGDFLEWVKKESQKLTVDLEDVENTAKFFFEKNVMPSDPVTPKYWDNGDSYVSMRSKQWAEKFEVLIKEGFLTIQKKEIKNV